MITALGCPSRGRAQSQEATFPRGDVRGAVVGGAGRGPRGRGLAVRANRAVRRGGEAGRRRGDAGARPGAEAELADPERIRRRAPRPRHSPGAGFLAARTVRGAPPRSRLCGVSGSWEPPVPSRGPSDGAAGGVLVPGAPALCPWGAGARRAREGGDEPPRHSSSTGCRSPAPARPCDGQVGAREMPGAREPPAGHALDPGLRTPQDLLAWG